MLTLACSAVAQAGMAATTASLDDTPAESLMFVAGWLTTATDLTAQAMLIRDLGASFDVLI
ncbi:MULTISPECIES: hypothetical protein [unclassified Modestobacter]|uniref:hypothetical protein n=1 Tax=unclassified Modestobacter TaxID=2643866 RepID=UPI0022AAA5F3|nr:MULTISPECIES: hypothetical protein [unclassified Modestobacter]MCZ2810071.1 hypothetical protein [Modestobacter sp. VKM Ac-2979]MCZ2844702.1 hypothetical protein [Modestobacter sp. VKM Ac-2980]MCZ2847133.1 hypothetical protein [Modestobacter sp. VKM Ac-2978]